MSHHPFRSMAVLLFGAIGFVSLGVPAGAGEEQAAAQLPALPADVWEAICFEDWRIGYTHTHQEYVEAGGETLVRVATTSHLEMQRLGDMAITHTHEVRYTTLEGALVRFEIEAQGGNYDRAVGEVLGGELRVTVVRGSEVAEQVIAWDAEIGIPNVVEETENSAVLFVRELDMSTFTVVEEARRITQEGFEETALYGGVEIKLLHARIESDRAGARQVWLNEEGEQLKTYDEALGIATYRVTKEVALAPLQADEFDLLIEMGSVILQDELPAGGRTTEAEYLVTLENGDPAEVLAAGPSQLIERVDEDTVRVVVRAIAPGDPAAEPMTDEQLREYLEANTFIQTEDELVAAMAREAAGDETDPWRLALRLEQFVHERMTYNTEAVFGSAAEVAEILEGDCTEHAVLLAALLRINGVPARVVAGLLYVPPGLQGMPNPLFGGHFWTEAYIDGVWVPLDAVLGQGGIGADHIRQYATSLAGGLPSEGSAVHRMDIEIVRSAPEGALAGTALLLDDQDEPAASMPCLCYADGRFDIWTSPTTVVRIDASSAEPYGAAGDATLTQVRAEFVVYDTHGFVDEAQWSIAGYGEFIIDGASVSDDGSLEARMRRTRTSLDGVSFVEVEEEFARVRVI